MTAEGHSAFNLAQRDLARGPAYEDLSDQGWNVRRGDVDFPMMVLKRDAVRHNVDLMAQYCRDRGVDLCPHGKTSMMPWLIEQQLAAGAWGMTAATPAQCKVYREIGVSRILLANELVDPGAIAWVANEVARGDLEFLCYVDSLQGVQIIQDALEAAAASVPLGVLVEFGYPGGRSGTRSVNEAVAVAGAVVASPRLTLRGVSGFEGFLRSDDPARVSDACRAYLADLQQVVRAVEQVRGSRRQPFVVTAGGSGYFDAVIEAVGQHQFGFEVQLILRSGCYVTHDEHMYEPISPLAGRGSSPDGPRLKQALELWATVWSRPEPELAIVGFGRRDTSYDFGLPVVQQVCSREGRRLRPPFGQPVVTQLNDQHAYVSIDAEDPLEVGDQLLLGVSHPCVAFSNWPWMAVVDEEYHLLVGARTYF